MKEKDGSNAEDGLAQLSNSRTSETAMKSLYAKLNSTSLSNVQRVRLLKTIILHCTKDGVSPDLRIAALSAGLLIAQSEFSASSNPAGGAVFFLLEVCSKITKEYVENPKTHHIDLVVKALELLSLANVSTLTKLFSDSESGKTFMKIVNSCLKNNALRLHSLNLLVVGLTVPKSEAVAEAICEEKIDLIQGVYPLIFNLEDSNVQGVALKVMQGLKLSSKPQPVWDRLKTDTSKVYCKRLVEMVNNKGNWPEVWQFVVNFFGEELHSGGQLINHMLEVLERAFKHSDFEWTRVQAFECWNTLIENFKSGLKIRKRIDLIMIPLKASNHRIETLAVAKLKTYDYLFKTLGEDLTSSPDILLYFLAFCFGSEKVTCLPVKSYPALQKKCAERVRDILVAPYSENIFTKASKELINAVGDCFEMENVSSVLLTQMWNRLLCLVQKQEGTDMVKTLLSMVNNLVSRAGSGELNDSLKVRRSMSPPSAPSTSQQPNEALGCKIVLIILHRLVHGEFALKQKLFMSRSLYVGSHDVMNGTLTLLFIEWLLSPALMLGAGNSAEFKKLFSKLISLQRKELNGFMEFTQLVLKKLSSSDDNLISNKKTLLHKYTTFVWCTLAEELVVFISNQGSINQGDAAEHDFSALYSILLFPVQYLYVDFDHIELCRQPWKDLFYEASLQAELVPTASRQILCKQVCVRLCGFCRRSSTAKQHASIYFFLTCIVEVASQFKSKESFRWVQLYISGNIKELKEFLIDQEVVLDQAVACILHCLQMSALTAEVVDNVSPTLCALLKMKINTFDSVDKLCTILEVLKQTSLFIQHGSTKETILGMLQGVIDAGKTNPSQKVRSTIRELSDAINEERPEDDEKSQITSSNSALSPTNRISFSPKSATKKFKTIQMSPSNLSAGATKRKLQATICGSDGKFVRIETPPKNIILTEHQKEVRRQRRQDIPALYQDLSQDTQSMSQDVTQDFVPLPATPKGKSNVVLDEDAVMDIVDVDSSIQVLSAKKIESPKCTRKGQFSTETKNAQHSFTPPAGFVLPSANECVSEPDAKIDNQEEASDLNSGVHPGKENEDVSSTSKSDKSNRTPRKGAMTRSSLGPNSTTRSGKVLKRNSLASDNDLLKQRKSARKSLQVNCLDEQTKKNGIETIVIESDTTDTESISSVASDVNGTNSKPRKSFISRQTRSLKRGCSFESDLDISEKKTVVNESDIDRAEADVAKTENEEALKVDDLFSSPESNLPLAKVFGGKILTRSRSNSSLDEVVLVSKKLKNPSPDDKDKVVSPVVQAKPPLKKSPDTSCHKSPSSNGSNSTKETLDVNTAAKSKSEDSPSCKKSIGSCDKPSVSDEQCSAMQRLFGSGAFRNSLTNSSDKKSVRPRSPEKVQSISPDRCVNEKPKEVQEESVRSPVSQTISHARQEQDDSSSFDDSNTEFGRGTEESQEIIESSQEPLIKLKPCLVSLEQFRCADPNSKVEIANVVIQKGPDERSPFKVLPKESPEIPDVKQKSVCRRSLMLDVTDKAQPASTSSIQTPLEREAVASGKPVSPICDNETAPKDTSPNDDASKKIPGTTECESKGMLKIIHSKVEEKEQDSSSSEEVIPQSRSDSMPDWMHNKKNSPPSKASRTIRSASARSQAFMKSVADAGFSGSPPKGIEVSPISSPVQSKKLLKTNSDTNSTPIIKRSSRAAQLLGLGQAAAARGGETVVSSAARSRTDKADCEDGDSSSISTTSTSSITLGCSSSSSSASNTILNTVSALASTPVTSPSVRRHGRLLDLDSLKSTPQKSLQDNGLKEDWVPKDPHAKATPDSSILKRKREADSDAPSPNLKRKRVSFRDPPLSMLLRFGETSEIPGTVFNSDQSTGSERAVEDVNSDNEAKTEIEGSAGSEIEKCAVQSVQLGESVSQVDSETHVEGKCSPQAKKSAEQSPETSPKKQKMTVSPQECNSAAQDMELDSGYGLGKTNADKSSKVKNAKEDAQDLPNQGRRKSLRKSGAGGSGQYETEPSCTAEQNWEQKFEHEMEIDNVADTSELNKSLEGGSEQSEIETQGMLDDLHRTPSVLSPVYINLVDCTHSVECILSKLTSAVWEKSLLQELRGVKIHTVGDFAKLTEEQLDRLSVKPPKLTNILCVLEDFEKHHSSRSDNVNCKFGKGNTLVPVASETRLEDILANSSQEDIIKALSKLSGKSEICQAMIQSLPPKEVLSSLKREDVLHSLKPEDVINSLEPEVVASVIGSNQDILKSLPADIGAEIYISQVHQSSGKNEKKLSVEDLTSILSRVPVGIVQDTLFPSTPSMLSSVYDNMMRTYVLRECDSSEILQELDSSKAKELAVRLIPQLSASVFAKEIENVKAENFGIELLPKLRPSSIAKNIDATKAQELGVQLLPNLSASILAQEIDSTKARELTIMLLSKMNPSDIADLIDDDKCEATIKALLSKFNVKKSLKILLKHGLNVVKELE